MLIVLEGPNKVGKTTQLNMLTEVLKILGLTIRGVNFQCLKFPTKKTTELLQTNTEVRSNNLANALAMASDFRSVLDQKVLNSDNIFLVDRFSMSTKIYHNEYKSIEEELLIDSILHIGTYPFKPHLVFCLQPVKDCYKEILNRPQGFDVYENEEEYKRICNKYRRLARKTDKLINVYITDKSQDEVLSEIWKHLKTDTLFRTKVLSLTGLSYSNLQQLFEADTMQELLDIRSEIDREYFEEKQ